MTFCQFGYIVSNNLYYFYIYILGWPEEIGKLILEIVKINKTHAGTKNPEGMFKRFKLANVTFIFITLKLRFTDSYYITRHTVI